VRPHPQHDPERGGLTNPLSLNPYLYVACNPVNATDPTGACTVLIALAALGLLLGTIGLVIGILTAPLGGWVLVGLSLSYISLLIGSGVLGWEYYEECISQT
jgi:hypothetical protein